MCEHLAEYRAKKENVISNIFFMFAIKKNSEDTPITQFTPIPT